MVVNLFNICPFFFGSSQVQDKNSHQDKSWSDNLETEEILLHLVK